MHVDNKAHRVRKVADLELKLQKSELSRLQLEQLIHVLRFQLEEALRRAHHEA